ncbi:MAG TPA: hypothetical protein VMT34_11985 [Aggregatilineales bacterium]|nr:hypothetical protein [Aggregatilineales bacterium]
MPGRIKSGEGTLIGNAGEYFVVAELLKRGIVAALAPRNTPAFDILATNFRVVPQKTVQIRVTTKSGQYDSWRWSTRIDGVIFPRLESAGDFTILVNLTDDTKHMDYFVLQTHVLNQWIIDDFEWWLAQPGKKGQPHSRENRLRALYYRSYEQKLEQYRNNWGILWT